MGPRGGDADLRMLRDLRFHDLRHEATSRLFKKGLNPMEVATITGPRPCKCSSGILICGPRTWWTDWEV